MPHVAHLAIRNRGTIGGSLSHADPAAELPMLAVFYGATIKAQGPERPPGNPGRGILRIRAGAIASNRKRSCSRSIFRFLTSHTGWAFEEVARRFGDFALACIAVSLERRDGRIADARVAVMGVADTPLRLREAEDALRGASGGPGTAAKFAAVVRAGLSPADDIHVSGEYRKHLIGALAEKALMTAWTRAAGDKP